MFDIHMPLICILLFLFLRQWVMIKATSGLPSTTDRKLLHENKWPVGKAVHNKFLSSP